MAKKDDRVRIQVFVSRKLYDKLVARVGRADKVSPARVSMSSYCAHALEQHVGRKKK